MARLPCEVFFWYMQCHASFWLCRQGFTADSKQAEHSLCPTFLFNPSFVKPIPAELVQSPFLGILCSSYPTWTSSVKSSVYKVTLALHWASEMLSMPIKGSTLPSYLPVGVPSDHCRLKLWRALSTELSIVEYNFLDAPPIWF